MEVMKTMKPMRAMIGSYWFNPEPISKYIDIIFEFEEFQFINEVVHLFSIDELKNIINSLKKYIEEKRPYTYVKEYFHLSLNFGLCTIEYELPNQSEACYIDGDKLVEILEKYVYKYEHIDDIFKL